MVRSGRPSRTELNGAATFPVRWKIVADLEVIAEGRELQIAPSTGPPDLPPGIYRLQLTDAAAIAEDVPLISAPATGVSAAISTAAGCWRSSSTASARRATGASGDFTDLARPDRTRAINLGADGIGLNPLHALFDDRPGDCSPYSPNSRLFLNALYIDVEKLPEFQPDCRDTARRWRGCGRRDRRLCRRRRSEMAGAARGLCRLQGRTPSRAASRISTKFRAERGAAAVALRLLRGAAAQIRQAMVGMAGRVAAAGRGQMRARCARARTPTRSNSSNSCNGSPTGSSGAASRSGEAARHEGRALSRRRGRRAGRRL